MYAWKCRPFLKSLEAIVYFPLPGITVAMITSVGICLTVSLITIPILFDTVASIVKDVTRRDISMQARILLATARSFGRTDIF